METNHDISAKCPSSPTSPPAQTSSSPASNNLYPSKANNGVTPTASVPALRFPRPNGSQVLASWISRSIPNIMSTDGSLSLTDSAYEVIYTDGESQDGHGTESMCSLDSPRTDDVHSIIGTDHVDDDDNAGHEDGQNDDDDDDDMEEHQLSGSEHTTSSPSRRSNSIEYADHALRTPSPHSAAASLQSLQSVHSLGLSIEFSEKGATLCQDNTSVKHTIRTLSKDESARVSNSMAIQSDDQVTLVAAIRQTMCNGYLCTNGPLRILYVGSHAARYDIIYKLSSALTASTSADDPTDSVSPQGGDRIYNIVPVSAFGSTKIPEVELMETSAFQIKVENCTAAEDSEAKDDNSGQAYPHNTGYTLTINGDRSVSLPQPPKDLHKTSWELPHVAVFYCTDNDDDSVRKTRDAAWGAMTSRGVPCLFIAHSLDFEKPPSGRWRGYLDPDTLHLSLESSNSDPGVIPERLPVDLNSFLTIDARQMNRNLAYITGLNGNKTDPRKDKRCNSRYFNYKQSSKSLNSYLSEFALPNWTFLFAILLGIGYLVGGYLSLKSPQGPTYVAMNASSISPSSAQTLTSTATVTVEHTSTRTVEVHRPDSSSAPWFFDSVIWPMPGRPVFTASKGANAVLLKIDNEYSHWVMPGRLRATVHRGSKPVMAQITVHDGQAVLVEFGRQDAHGVLTVRVETTQKPRVHESYEIDFGRPFGLFDMPFSYVHTFALNLAAAANETARSVPQSYGSGIHAFSEAFDQAASRSSSVLQQIKDVSRYTATLAQHVKHDTRTTLVEAGHKLVSQFPSSQAVQHRADLALLKAQISSKLWWLKLQGKRQEYEIYEQRAIQFLEEKMQQLSSAAKDIQTPGRTGMLSYLKGDW